MLRTRLTQAARQQFEQAFGPNAALQFAVAPGRINLIGEHTDYNDGFVLPMAIDRYVVVAFAPRQDRLLRVHSQQFGQTRDISLDVLEQRSAEPGRRSGRGGWFGYVAGVAWAMLSDGHRLRGVDMAIVSDLPSGSACPPRRRWSWRCCGRWPRRRMRDGNRSPLPGSASRRSTSSPASPAASWTRWRSRSRCPTRRC